MGGGGSGGDKHLYRSVAVLAKIEHTVRNQYNIRGSEEDCASSCLGRAVGGRSWRL